MSWKATAYVKELTKAPNGDPITPGEKLFLFVLADYHHTQHEIMWPSQATLAREALTSERNVRRMADSLVEKGLLAVETHQGRGRTAVYRFSALSPEKPDNTSGLEIDDEDLKGDIGSNKRGHKPDNGDSAIRKNGVTGLTVNPSTSVPSVEDVQKKVDPRHQYFVTRHRELYMQTNKCPANEVPWGPAAAGVLARVLKNNPGWTMDFLERCLVNHFASEGNPAVDPKLWLGNLVAYRNSALDRFGHPKAKPRTPDDGGDSLADALRQRQGRGSP